jgi:hypothetical protein
MSRILVLASLLALTAACSSPAKAVDDAGSSSPPDACGTGGVEADGGCSPYVSCSDLTTPTVSFAADIVPIIQPSCAIAGNTCHGTTTGESEGLYLGSYDGGTDASFVVQGLVGTASLEDPSMVIVKASDPSNSYLMHKLDGDMCTLATSCASSTTQYTDCGQQMPYSSPPLDEATRDIIRRWIAQGAKNN